MGLDFLRDNGARRVRDFAPQPLLLGDGVSLSPTEDKCLDLSIETPAEEWRPHTVQLDGCGPDEAWAYCPSRFVDGKDVGRTIAWLQSLGGYPIPVRLSEIGAVALRTVETPDGERALRREWNKVEEFAIGLQGSGFRLLPVRGEAESDDEADDLPIGFDFERMRQKTFDRTKDEMIRLEREALSSSLDAATIVDGGLEARSSAFAPTEPVIGLIKTHSVRNQVGEPGAAEPLRPAPPGQAAAARRRVCRACIKRSWNLVKCCGCFWPLRAMWPGSARSCAKWWSRGIARRACVAAGRWMSLATTRTARRIMAATRTIVNRQLGNMSRYALFVGILKHRFGTPTPRAGSGTNEEFKRAVKAFERTGRLRIMLYFSDAAFRPRGDEDMKQKQKVLDFRRQVEPLSLHWRYNTQAEFHRLFTEHFNGWIEDHIKAAS